MIVSGACVLVPAAVCPTVARALGIFMQRERLADPVLARLLEELALVARWADPSDDPSDERKNGSELWTDDLSWWTVSKAAAELGIGERAVRYRCSNGRLPAHKENGSWRIAPASQSPELRSSDRPIRIVPT